MNFINEKILEDYPRPISLNQSETILKQMKNYVFQICKKDGSKGTGFFCRIPLSNNKSLPVFITNNHLIDKKYLNEESEIILQINKGQNNNIKSISLKNKLTYTNENYDTTIIEINENKEKISEYLELDENILDHYINYIGTSIYILHYPNANNVAVSYGILKQKFDDKDYDFLHYCSTDYGSSGAPILNLENNKIIGIHKQRSLNKNFNVGSFLYYPLKEFINIYNHKQNKFTIKNENIMNNFQYEDKNDIIMKLYYKLYNKGLVSGLIQFTKEDKYRHNNYIAIKKFIITQRNLPFNYYNTWIPAWHGTKFNYLESIVENGLRLPGTKLKNGIITQSPNNIPFTEDVLGIKNWENTIFASQNIYYSLGYCDIIGEREEKFDPYPIPDNWGWKGLVEVRI